MITGTDAIKFRDKLRDGNPPALSVEPYDPISDTIVIEGTRYSADFFRNLGCNFPGMVGQVLRIDKKEDGVVTVTRLPELE